jgi:hypothetical protein
VVGGPPGRDDDEVDVALPHGARDGTDLVHGTREEPLEEDGALAELGSHAHRADLVEAQGVDRTERDREHDPIETRKG